MRFSLIFRPLVAILALAAPACFAQQTQRPLRAQRASYEQILDFHSDITLRDDASLLVTETITVLANNNQIRHGIYREFPTRYIGSWNNKYVVGFQMISATCDGAAEQFRVEDYSNGKKIYLGDPKYFVNPGRHAYTITYTTNRQLGFFQDHDELFWNVTGNSWGFDIEHSSATVHLPEKIPAERVELFGFTGFQGSREAAFTTATQGSTFEFTTTRPAAAW